MTLLFDRRVELHIFAGNTRTIIDKLDIEFEVTLHRRATPNEARIVVYNLPGTLRSVLAEKHQGVELYAGYKNKIAPIFRGATAGVNNVRDRVDWATELICGDGEKEYSTNRFDRSYAAGTSINKILIDVASAMGLPFEIDDTFLSDTLLFGETYSGRVKDVLKEVTGDHGFTWSIQFGVLEIIRGSTSSKSGSAVVIAERTGMLGQPVITERGVKIQSLLNSDIVPNRIVKVEAVNVQRDVKLLKRKKPADLGNGLYVVDTVRHAGNNFGGDYYSEVDGDRERD